MRLLTITHNNVPAIETLRYVTALANHKFRFSADNQVIVEPTYTTALITKVYRVPAKSISTQVGTVKGPDGVTYPSVNELLTAFGVTFPEGATAGLPIGGEGIAMRNTQANLDIGEVIATALIEADGGKLSDEELDLIRTQIEGLKPVGR